MATTTVKPPAIAGTGNGPYSASDVASEVISQGGSMAQAWVAAALVSGIESNGTLNDKNPSSTACGLFQFLTTTWISNGGGQYATSACGASLAQQVAVFIQASGGPGGTNFYPWAPDLGGSYNGKPISAPGAGSAVAGKIASLAAGGTLSWLGNVPTSWADSGSVLPASPTPIPLGNNGVNVGGSLTGLSGLEAGIDALLGDLTSSAFWQRIGIFVLGVGFVIGGLILFVSTTKTGQKVESDAAVAAVA